MFALKWHNLKVKSTILLMIFSKKQEVACQVKACSMLWRDCQSSNLQGELSWQREKNTAPQLHVSRKDTTRKKTCTSFNSVLTTGDWVTATNATYLPHIEYKLDKVILQIDRKFAYNKTSADKQQIDQKRRKCSMYNDPFWTIQCISYLPI